MSDSFADLWTGSAPKQQKQTLGQSQSLASSRSSTPLSNGQQRRGAGGDLFSMLAAQSSPPSSRPLTPSLASQSRNQTPPLQQAKPSAQSALGSDAFSNLLGGSFPSSANSRMTMAQAEAKKNSFTPPAKQNASSSNTAWAGLDSWDAIGSTSSTTQNKAVAAPAAKIVDDDDWGLEDFGKQAPQSSKPTQSSNFDFDDFASAPITKVSNQSQNKEQDQDDDEWGIFSKPARQEQPSAVNNVSEDFDFGEQDRNRQRGLLDSDSDGEAPVRTTLRNRPGGQRSASPPIHLVGQIVEMGFSPVDARKTLDSTKGNDGKWNVEAAIERLLSQKPVEQPARPRETRPPQGESRRQRATPSPQPPSVDPSTLEGVNFQEQADRLLAQASELSKGMFSRANALWASGKKLYEETAAAAIKESGQVAGKQPVRDGRPKWMTDANQSDEDQERLPPANLKEEHVELAKARAPPKPRQPVPPREPSPPVDLFSDAPAKPYVSRFRHAVPSASSSKQHVPAPTPAQKPKRPVVPAAQSALSASSSHAASAASMIALGQFGTAADKYTLAVDSLPTGHTARIAVLNGRASARLKTGDYKGVLEDSTEVLVIIGSWDEIEYREARILAWRSRAEANENREKWADALKDWNLLANANWADKKFREEAARGSVRCRKMTEPQKPRAPLPKAAPPVSKPRPNLPQKDSAAVKKLRNENQAIEAEAEEKLNQKDNVDGKLLAWKAGKEANLRGLIASLDTVLWPSLGWKAIGMSELITSAQVKKAYVRAIAKVHPDKLNASNTTVQERMIANGVFGALNEAWNSFKP